MSIYYIQYFFNKNASDLKILSKRIQQVILFEIFFSYRTHAHIHSPTQKLKIIQKILDTFITCGNELVVLIEFTIPVI